MIKFRVRDPGTKSYIFNGITIDEALRTKNAFLPQDVVYELSTTVFARDNILIYVGDIVQSIVGLRGIVRFGFHTLPVAEYDGERTIGYFVDIGGLEKSLGDGIFDRRRVVGNIYQNPELLSEK